MALATASEQERIFPFSVPDRRMATDAFQLSNDIFRFNPGSKSQRDQATDCLGLRGCTTSCLSDLIKDLKKLSLLILVHRHIEVSTTGADLSGGTMDHILASLWLSLSARETPLPPSIDPARGNHPFIKNLFRPTPIPVDGHSLATQFVSQLIDLGHIIDGRLMREIDRLGNGIVCILLKSRLHPDMILRSDIMGGHKEFSDVLRNFFKILDIPAVSDLPHQLFRIESFLLRQCLKEWIDFQKFFTFQDMANKGQSKDGFDP